MTSRTLLCLRAAGSGLVSKAEGGGVIAPGGGPPGVVGAMIVGWVGLLLCPGVELLTFAWFRVGCVSACCVGGCVASSSGASLVMYLSSVLPAGPAVLAGLVVLPEGDWLPLWTSMGRLARGGLEMLVQARGRASGSVCWTAALSARTLWKRSLGSCASAVWRISTMCGGKEGVKVRGSVGSSLLCFTRSINGVLP